MSAKSTSHDTWMPFYPGAYLRQTGRLTAAQHGAYLLLLLEAWAHDGLIPEDDHELAQITRMSAKEWRANKAKVLRFWTAAEGGYRQERLDQELARAKHLVSVKSEAGKASAEARKRQRTGNNRSTPVGTDAPTDGEQTAIQSQSPYSDTNVSGAEAPIDPDAKAWREAVSILTAGDRMTAPKARQLFGKLLKTAGVEARSFLPSLAKCIEIGTLDPQSYLTKAAQGLADRRRGGSPAPTASDEPINWPWRLEQFRGPDRIWVESMWGPRPGHPDCQCPPHLLEEPF